MGGCEDELINGVDRLGGSGDCGDCLRANTCHFEACSNGKDRDPSRERYFLVSSNSGMLDEFHDSQTTEKLTPYRNNPTDFRTPISSRRRAW